MKLVIFSDLHANWEALSALQRVESQPDAVLFLGDIVNFGPDPKRCLDWVRTNATAAVRGNHDHGVAFGGELGVNPGLLAEYRVMRDFTQNVLPAADRGWLGNLPLSQDVELDGARFHLVHAMPSDPLARRLALVSARQEDLEAEVAQLSPRPDVLMVGHTHLPGMRKVGDTIIVNPGSLGQPRNGIPDATYAVWRDGDLQIHHLHYDHDTTQRKLMMLPIDPDVVDRLQEILETGSA
ncbi:MAG: metallophosphoesterase family protein [Anaerolineae bacterium]|nr:metallophosphoesterase family protein [Anaerolineae bacterium]MCB0254148.1 metallophosphoesterase family protein [Anaerolineae bacterium]